jgi:ferredoxin/flavodoxin
MNKNVIFCYSGTGNCLDLAKNIARGIGGADIIMMRSAPAVTDVREAERVGFVFPCYGGGAPSDVLKYARTIQIDPKAYTFAVSQSASYAGTGLYELNKIIPLKYWKLAKHQCSCIWLFPHSVEVPPATTKGAQKRSEKTAAKIANDILAHKLTEKKPPRNPANRAENAAWPVIAKKKAAKFAVSEACIGCGQCAKLCPRHNIRIRNKRPEFGTDCAQCLGCLQFCEQEAISIGKITDKREHYHNPNVVPEDLMQEIIHI